MRDVFHGDHYLRYRPALDLLHHIQPETILDVGCGSWGIGAFTNQPFTGCDVQFSPPVCPHMRAVQGSVLALPFGDRSFDLVICSDVLEHLSPVDRTPAIAELLRVTGRCLWLACPTGVAAEETDRGIARSLSSRGKALPEWLREHLEYPFPYREDIEAALAAAGGTVRCIRLENWRLHQLIAMADLSRLGCRLLRLLPRACWDLLATHGNLQPTYRTAFLFERDC